VREKVWLRSGEGVAEVRKGCGVREDWVSDKVKDHGMIG